MKQFHQYAFEGEVIEVTVYWDNQLQREVEDYADYIQQPVYTPAGRPILLTIEDACPYADTVDGGLACIDCGSCRHYYQFPGSLLGVCKNEKRRAPERGQGAATGIRKEETR